jgi:uncharacterized protein (TIGR02996 family)
VSAADAFLRTVLDHPNDDSPRLVYADWLEEQGDPRGEFIRLQIELNRHGPMHPEYKGWMRRAAELFRNHGREWGRSLGGWVRRCRFRRGFAETVWVEWEHYAACAAAVRQLTPVRDVFVDLAGRPALNLDWLALPTNAIHFLPFVPLGVRPEDDRLVVATRPPITRQIIHWLEATLSRPVAALPADEPQLATARQFLFRRLDDERPPEDLVETVEIER